MRKICFLIIVFCFVLIMFSCSSNDIVIKGYTKKECYYSDSVQDHTDYCKYIYDTESIKKYESHSKFHEVKEKDIKNIRSYFRHFSDYVANQSYCDNFDFDFQSQIKKGDYFCIITKEGSKIGDSYYGKFDDYKVYYVDVSKNILFYIYSGN